jgi:hypothetical protein
VRPRVDEHREEKELHVSREQSRHPLLDAFVGHVNDVDAGAPPQHLAEQVTGGPGADRAVVELAGMRPRRATSSSTDLAGTAPLTTSTMGTRASSAIGEKSLSGS